MKSIKFLGIKILPLLLVMGVLVLGGCGDGSGSGSDAGSASGSAQ